MSNYLIGIDIGGTKIEAVLYQLSSKDTGEKDTPIFSYSSDKFIQEKNRKRIPTQRQNGYIDVCQRLATLIKDITPELAQLKGIGLALPGTVHPQSKKMINGNSAIFIDRPIVADLQEALGQQVPIMVENDANCFALAEALCGAGLLHQENGGKRKEEQIAIGIILGTGCGGGLTINGQIYSGAHGGGSEIGHQVLYPNGHACYCGRFGCAEQYLSGPAIEAAFASRLYSHIEQRPNAGEIFKMVQAKEPLAMAILSQYRRDLLEFLTNLASVLDPDYFVLGGGVSTQSEIYENLEELLAEKVFVKGSRPRIYQHQIGDSAGALGAALLLKQIL
jgi:predicted NBD/HSP70 family sugar kinase